MAINRDENGRLKRIEYRGKHLRASRTGGVSLRAQTKVSGVNLTANTSRGIRVSTRVAKGTQIGFQNKGFLIRGRYGKGPHKLNLSKSGVSVSSKTGIGTYNWMKPQYSSAKIAGIQIRGKKAQIFFLIYGIFKLSLFLCKIIIWLLKGTFYVSLKCYDAMLALANTQKAKMLESLEDKILSATDNWSAVSLEQILDNIYFDSSIGQELDTDKTESTIYEAKILEWLEECKLNEPQNLEFIFGCLAKKYAEKVGSDEAIDKLLALDDNSTENGGKNELQEELLDIYASSCGIEDNIIEDGGDVDDSDESEYNNDGENGDPEIIDIDDTNENSYTDYNGLKNLDNENKLKEKFAQAQYPGILKNIRYLTDDRTIYLDYTNNSIGKDSGREEKSKDINEESEEFTNNQSHNQEKSEKKFKTLLIVCLLTGIFGGHRFYCGKYITGFLMLITWGMYGIWWIVDIVLILKIKFKDSKGLLIQK
mgnify:CR=1 FL=1